jgi:hypothetical protein
LLVGLVAAVTLVGAINLSLAMFSPKSALSRVPSQKACKAEIALQLSMAQTVANFWASATSQQLPQEVVSALVRLKFLNSSTRPCAIAEAGQLAALVVDRASAVVSAASVASKSTDTSRCDVMDTLKFGIKAPTVDGVLARADLALRQGLLQTEPASILGMRVDVKDFNPVDATQRVAALTVCFGSAEHLRLCDAWWRAWNHAAQRLGVAVVRVMGSLDDMPDRGRAPQWQKVSLLRALLKAELPTGPVDLGVFVDADSMIRRYDVDIREWAARHLGDRPIVMATDAWDVVTTGEIFARGSADAIDFLEKWYRYAPEQYGRVNMGDESTLLPAPVGQLSEPIDTSVSNWWNGTKGDHPAFFGPKSWRDWAIKASGQDMYGPRPWFVSPVQRCWSFTFSHEQGCLLPVIHSYPEMKDKLALIGDLEMRHFRMQQEGPALFLHACCRATGEKIDLMVACTTHLNSTDTPC